MFRYNTNVSEGLYEGGFGASNRVCLVLLEERYDDCCTMLQPQEAALISEFSLSLSPKSTSLQYNKETEIQIRSLFEANIIKPSHNLYAAPVTLVMKKDKSMKALMCIHTGILNQANKTDS
ncbi:hypothetical protein NPIL_138661 [Nephila pilipes]|uniref:Uncharacterized protein n=1 Tax=Nephila pilipes TaxID=299642 RepID=A0A8X6PNT2_NEPPI|nr:hypothetical protein NPIL_138661 [Nephila pilipes]